MISVVIPTLNAEKCLAGCLSALVTAAVEGVVQDVTVVDAGSTDSTLKIADQAGVRLVASQRGRGVQLREGARYARAPWLMFLHADTELAPGWQAEAAKFIEAVDIGRRRRSAAVFSYALDDDGAAPRILETLVGIRSRFLKLPYGDQGLLIPRALYDELGGYKPLALMEDVDLVRRLGGKRITVLRSQAVTSAERYRETGYIRRVARNQLCLALYACGFSGDRIARIYGGDRASDEKTAGVAAPLESSDRVQ